MNISNVQFFQKLCSYPVQGHSKSTDTVTYRCKPTRHPLAILLVASRHSRINKILSCDYRHGMCHRLAVRGGLAKKPIACRTLASVRLAVSFACSAPRARTCRKQHMASALSHYHA